VSTTVVGHALPGIVPCGLWDVLREPHDGPAYALLTDVGNDIAYGHSPAAILGWIDLCLARLADARARIVITDLPTHTLHAMPEWCFQLIRALLFPTKRLVLRDVLEAVDTVSAGLRDLAAKYDARLVGVEQAWYGLDGIHLRRRLRARALAFMLDAWSDHPLPPNAVNLVGCWSRITAIYRRIKSLLSDNAFAGTTERRRLCHVHG
jgi:hypothetical protein